MNTIRLTCDLKLIDTTSRTVISPKTTFTINHAQAYQTMSEANMILDHIDKKEWLGLTENEVYVAIRVKRIVSIEITNIKREGENES
jgi:hypothetical protein